LARPGATGQSSRDVEDVIIGTLLPSAILGAVRGLHPLIDRRLKRDAAPWALLRDDDVERRAWAPAG
jgi:hypothetical protein